MEKKKDAEKVRKPFVMAPEFWAKVETRINANNENFTVYVTRLIREDLEKRKSNNP